MGGRERLLLNLFGVPDSLLGESRMSVLAGDAVRGPAGYPGISFIRHGGTVPSPLSMSSGNSGSAFGAEPSPSLSPLNLRDLVSSYVLHKLELPGRGRG